MNVLGLVLTTQEAIKHIGPEGGSIINISSIVGPMPVATGSGYSATKAAVDALTIAHSQELGPKKIWVNSLNPGMVETKGLAAVGFDTGDFRKHLEQQTPLGRIAQPEDIAKAAVFFASDDAGWVTGADSDSVRRPTAVSYFFSTLPRSITRTSTGFLPKRLASAWSAMKKSIWRGCLPLSAPYRLRCTHRNAAPRGVPQSSS